MADVTGGSVLGTVIELDSPKVSKESPSCSTSVPNYDLKEREDRNTLKGPTKVSELREFAPQRSTAGYVYTKEKDGYGSVTHMHDWPVPPLIISTTLAVPIGRGF